MGVELVCMRLDLMKQTHPQQDNSRVCSQCKMPVGIYPSGQQVLKDEPTAVIICHICAKEDIKNGIPAPGAIEEMLEQQGRK